MKIDQLHSDNSSWTFQRQEITDYDKQTLVLIFGDRLRWNPESVLGLIRKQYSHSDCLFSTTSGDIAGTSLMDSQLSITAIQMEKTPTVIQKINVKSFTDSREAGSALGKSLSHEGLKHVFLISDGQFVNGSELAKGIHSSLPKTVTVSGGLAGDDTRFQSTLVGLNDDIQEGNIVAIGFYGDQIKIGLGSMGGWDSFGPERTITKAENNVLFELDNESALDLYKIYLGDKAKGLPGSALLFPLQIIQEGKPEPLVRTILNVNEENGSMIFAGDMPVGAKAQFMKANFEKLIDGASIAAEYTLNKTEGSPDLALLVSCVGRRLVLGQRTEEELEAVKEILGEKTALTGFYSYGELCPTLNNLYAELHNQTMTITTLKELV